MQPPLQKCTEAILINKASMLLVWGVGFLGLRFGGVGLSPV